MTRMAGWQGSASAVGALVAGMSMDYFGSKFARMMAGTIALIGALLLGSAGPEDLSWFAPTSSRLLPQVLC